MFCSYSKIVLSYHVFGNDNLTSTAVKYVVSSQALMGFFHLRSKLTHQHINSQGTKIINTFFFKKQDSCSLVVIAL